MVESIYDGYVNWCNADGTLASRKTFYRTWASGWSSVLRILPPCAHAKCTECEKFKLYLKKLSDPDDHEKLKQLYRQHVADNLGDRRVATRGENLSKESTARLPVIPEGQTCLNMNVDGMDMAKFCVPRNTNNSKLFDEMHRPKLHCIGALAHGVGEYYYIMDADQKKDANTMCQIIATTLDHVDRVLKEREVAMPSALTLHSDNCSREMKNQTVAKLGCKLCHDTFEGGVEHTQQRKGHIQKFITLESTMLC